MASAFVSGLRPREKRTPNTCGFIVRCYFAGNDVPDNLEGTAQELDFEIAIGYTLADLKTAMLNSIIAYGAILGLTVLSTDIDIIGFESGP